MQQRQINPFCWVCQFVLPHQFISGSTGKKYKLKIWGICLHYGAVAHFTHPWKEKSSNPSQLWQSNNTVGQWEAGGRCGGEIKGKPQGYIWLKNVISCRQKYLALISIVYCCFCPFSTSLLIVNLCQCSVVFLWHCLSYKYLASDIRSIFWRGQN